MWVDITERDKPTTWADVKPARKVSPTVRKAERKYDIAVRVRNEQIDKYLDMGEWNQAHINDLDNAMDEAYRAMLTAKHNALNECYCSEAMAQACEVCKQANADHYGDRIPIRGEL
jgi:hypothetical protein